MKDDDPDLAAMRSESWRLARGDNGGHCLRCGGLVMVRCRAMFVPASDPDPPIAIVCPRCDQIGETGPNNGPTWDRFTDADVAAMGYPREPWDADAEWQAIEP